MQNKTTNLSQFILWFGAAVSIAEILTGAMLVPLGLAKGFAAILTGHIIGAVILYLAGTIGAQSKLSAIESTRISFGKYGSFLFAALNIIQLLGWTAVMILNGAQALNAVSGSLFHFTNETLWCIIITLLIALWILLGIKSFAKVNLVAVSALFVLTVILGITVFSKSGANLPSFTESMSFGTAVELNVAMSISWLPLIADYTRNLKKERTGTICSILGYFLGSSFMFLIGLGASLYAGTSDIASILLASGLGLAAFLIVLFSTVTTTFLDAYSAGVSSANFSKKINEKAAALIVCGLGAVLAIFVPMSQYENFLYLIGSVFAPLFAILLTEYFILKIKSVNDHQLLNMKNILIWLLGFVAYRLLVPYDFILGITLPVMVGVSLVCIFITFINGGVKSCSKRS